MVGALAGLGLLALLSIGLLLLVAAIALAVLFARRTESRAGLEGFVSGQGLPLLFVAWMNRSGPGNVCSAIPGGQTCAEQWAPLPWLVVGLLLVAAGMVAATYRHRRSEA